MRAERPDRADALLRDVVRNIRENPNAYRLRFELFALGPARSRAQCERIQARREASELRGRTLMGEGVWPVWFLAVRSLSSDSKV